MLLNQYDFVFIRIHHLLLQSSFLPNRYLASSHIYKFHVIDILSVILLFKDTLLNRLFDTYIFEDITRYAYNANVINKIK